MQFRSPVYINENSLADIADAYDVDTRETVAVTEREASSRSGGGALRARVVEVRGDRGSERETEETFTRQRSAISLLDKVLEKAHLQGDIVTDGVAATRGSLLEVEGVLRPSRATEFVDMVRMFLPHLETLMAAMPGMQPEQGALLTQVLEEIGNPDNPSLWELEREEDGAPRVLVQLSNQHLWRESSMDDVEGDRTLLGLVDALVGDGQEFSLEKHLMPGLNRGARRALPTDAMEGMLRSVVQRPGGTAPEVSLTIPGPLFVVRAVAIY